MTESIPPVFLRIPHSPNAALVKSHLMCGRIGKMLWHRIIFLLIFNYRILGICAV